MYNPPEGMARLWSAEGPECVSDPDKARVVLMSTAHVSTEAHVDALYSVQLPETMLLFVFP